MDKLVSQKQHDKINLGNVYVMSHSFFSDIVRIGCTEENPQKYADSLSKQSPGQYTVVFSLPCSNPCKVKQQIKDYLNAQEYVNDFYQLSADTAKKILRQESLRIPTLNAM